MNHLVVSCVGTKSLEGPRLRDYSGTLDERFREWRKAIKRQENKKKARCLYGGAMWNASLEAYQELREPKELWVVSAGLGLINGDDKVPGYQATFKSRVEDSVANRVSEKRRWWNKLTKTNFTDGISGVSELINQLSSDDSLVMALGKDYYQAIKNDLQKSNKTRADIALVGIKKQNNKLTPKIPKQLQNKVVPYTDFNSLRSALGCSAIQVHPKTAKKLIGNYRKNGSFEIDLNGLEEVR